MRTSCLDCARKHLAKACINMNEARLGYRDHKWLAIGHMSEAEDELLKEYQGFALIIRDHRKAYEEDWEYSVPILELIRMLTDEEEKSLLGEELQRDHQT